MYVNLKCAVKISLQAMHACFENCQQMHHTSMMSRPTLCQAFSKHWRKYHNNVKWHTCSSSYKKYV